jgi:ribonuclease HII
MESFYTTDKIEVGIDEAGCGAFAGPVVSAGVILPRDGFAPDEKKLFDKIRDSKKISENVRKQLSEFIKKHAIDYSIQMVDNKVIDKINILNARYEVYKKVLDNLDTEPELILMDGDKFKPYLGNNGFIPYVCIEQGDSKYKSIASASILAKVARDNYMYELSKLYPDYNWESNKGYGSKEHRYMIELIGITPYHRKTFGICKTIEN